MTTILGGTARSKELKDLKIIMLYVRLTVTVGQRVSFISPLHHGPVASPSEATDAARRITER